VTEAEIQALEASADYEQRADFLADDLRKAIAEIKLLRSQLHDTRDSSDPFPTVGGKEEKP
jgi:hypothetical protein